MVKIRLTELGKHKNHVFRIVTIDSRVKRDGGYLELLGTFQPKTGAVKINKEKTLAALKNGAQPSETILNILKKNKIWEEFTKSKKPKKVHKRKAKKSAKKAVAPKETKPAEAKPTTPTEQAQ